MNKNLIALVVLAIVTISGLLIVTNSDDTKKDKNTNTASSEQANVSSDNLVSADNPLGLDASEIVGPYRVNIETTDADGTSSSGYIEFDADGNTKTSITTDGQENTIIVYEGTTYAKNPETDSWIQYPQSNNESNDSDELNVGLSQEDVDAINDTDIVDKGTGSCSAGTCRIYESTDPENGDTSVIKVDQATNRLSDVEVTSTDGEISKISYDYNADVNLSAPEDAIEFSVPGLEDIDLDSIPQ